MVLGDLSTPSKFPESWMFQLEDDSWITIPEHYVHDYDHPTPHSSILFKQFLTIKTIDFRPSIPGATDTVCPETISFLTGKLSLVTDI